MCKDYWDKRDYFYHYGDRGKDRGCGDWEKHWEGRRRWGGERAGDFGDEWGPFGFQRHFLGKQELIDKLEKYRIALLNEAAGVLEAIEELRKESRIGYDVAPVEETGDIGKEKKPRRRRGRRPRRVEREEGAAE